MNAAVDGYVIGLLVQGHAPHQDSSETRFRRMVYLRPLCRSAAGSSDNYVNYIIRDDGQNCGGAEKIGIQAETYVSWTAAGGAERSVELVERMFNWR